MCVPLGHSFGGAWYTPARTPGPLGYNDQGDPTLTTLLGDTPGPLGFRDYADPSRPSFAGAGLRSELVQPASDNAVPLALGTKGDKPADDKVLTFPGTEFRYQRTTKTLASCLETLPAGLRTDFDPAIRSIITKMHELGFALGVKASAKAGYRTFDDQAGLGAEATKAGPGESLHNYLCAVDLGFLEWVDEDGKARSDFWLGTMDGLPKYKGFSALLWEKRNSCSDAVFALSWEIIHLQGVPANTSGRALLAKCLNQAAVDAGDSKWQYRVKGAKQYECTLGSAAGEWKNVGTAKELWSKAATNCSEAERQVIRKHMEGAETLATTIALS
jgi:hypothetical protein